MYFIWVCSLHRFTANTVTHITKRFRLTNFPYCFLFSIVSRPRWFPSPTVSTNLLFCVYCWRVDKHQSLNLSSYVLFVINIVFLCFRVIIASLINNSTLLTDDANESVVYGGQSIMVPVYVSVMNTTSPSCSAPELPPVDNLIIDNMEDLVDVEQLDAVEQVTKTAVEFLLTRYACNNIEKLS